MLIILLFATVLIGGLVYISIYLTKPKNKYLWLSAMATSFVVAILVIAWHFYIPLHLPLQSWKPLISSTPNWLITEGSWKLATGIGVFGFAVLLTMVIRPTVISISRLGILSLIGIGIFAVISENPLALVLSWGILDLLEIGFSIASNEGKRNTSPIFFLFRVISIFLVLWIVAPLGIGSTFQAIPTERSIFLVLVVFLRIGYLPFDRTNSPDDRLNRDLGLTMKFISTTVGVAVVSKLSIIHHGGNQYPILVGIVSAIALITSIFWLLSSSEEKGLWLWIISISSLAIASALQGNSDGAINWIVLMILVGGMLFFYTARHRYIFWFLVVLGTWGMTSLPFSLSASVWGINGSNSWYIWLLTTLTQISLIVGYIKQLHKTGDSSIESHPTWARTIYLIGLSILPMFSIIIGSMDWSGIRNYSYWWSGIIIIFAAAIISAVLLRRNILGKSKKGIDRFWMNESIINSFPDVLKLPYKIIERGIALISNSVEGDAGVLWSFVLAVLFLSLIIAIGNA